MVSDPGRVLARVAEAVATMSTYPFTIEDHLARVRVVGKWCCWRLPHRVDSDGYVTFYVNFKSYRAHRFIYKNLIGPISRKLTLDHLCRNRWCCNPNHVAPVTNKVNCLRGESPCARNARKTRCPYGHPYNKKNTRIRTNGGRRCIACMRNKPWERA